MTSELVLAVRSSIERGSLSSITAAIGFLGRMFGESSWQAPSTH